MTEFIDVSTSGQCTRGQMERQKKELYLSLSYLNVTDQCNQDTIS